MGTVHARSLEPLPSSGTDFGALGEEAEFVEVEPEAKQEILENKDVVVQHVHFDGLGRTKDDIIICEIGEVFKAKNLIEVMRRSHEAREKLLRLGIFRQVDVLIDTCHGEDALPNGLDVTFEVTELRRLTGSYNTMVGNNEGSMVGFSVNLYKVTGQFPWSSLRETDRGVSAEYSFPLWKTSHTVKWEGVWRELGCLSRTASFAVRKESGHSLKSSLSHAMVIDSRNSSILPRRGALFKVNQELAGYTGGDVSFIKEDFELQLNKPLALDSVFSTSLWGGMLVPIGDKPSSIADRFYLGGPTSVRGFSMHSIGPQSEGFVMVSSLELGFGSCNLSPRGSLDEKQASPRLQAYLEVTRLSASGPESLWEITSINFKRSAVSWMWSVFQAMRLYGHMLFLRTCDSLTCAVLGLRAFR